MKPQPLFKRGESSFVAMGRLCTGDDEADLVEHPLRYVVGYGCLWVCKPGEAATTLKGDVRNPAPFVKLRQDTLEFGVKLRRIPSCRDAPFWSGVTELESIRFYRLGKDGEPILQTNFNWSDEG